MTIESILDETTQARRIVADHLAGIETLGLELARHHGEVVAWAGELAARLSAGHRLLVAGNGGSAAEAQHLAGELVGRFKEDRPAFSALALTADTVDLTAIGNDYGFAEVFARQVSAHSRPGDVLLLLSTSGRSENLLGAVPAARAAGATVWALTGPGPNPLAGASDSAIAVDSDAPHVQEGHLILVHALCGAFDALVTGRRGGETL